MHKYSNAERIWYNLKDSFHFYRELIFGPPWSKRKGNKGKKKPCLFIRFLDCIGRDFEETGQNMNKIIDRDVKATEEFNKKLGLPPEANNAKRFL